MTDRLPLYCSGEQYAAASKEQQDDMWRRLLESWRQNAERELDRDYQKDFDEDREQDGLHR